MLKNFIFKIRNNLIISKTDKGNCIVILDNHQYISLSNAILTEPEFSKISRNPLPSYINLLNKTCKNTFPTIKKLYQILKIIPMSKNPLIQTLYTFSKIHKPTLYMRPIVRFYKS